MKSPPRLLTTHESVSFPLSREVIEQGSKRLGDSPDSGASSPALEGRSQRRLRRGEGPGREGGGDGDGEARGQTARSGGDDAAAGGVVRGWRGGERDRAGDGRRVRETGSNERPALQFRSNGSNQI